MKGATRATATMVAEEPQASSPLPDKPLVTIKPPGRWAALELRNLWAHREVLYFLTWRDVKLRYRQTLLGVMWAIIQPLFLTLLFTIVLGALARFPSYDLPYMLFAYSGLMLWVFFMNAVTNGANSLIKNSQLITKVYFPRMIIPSSAVGAGLVDLAIASVVLVGLMIYYGVEVTWGIAMLPVLVALTVLFTLGLGIWLSALNVKYRDIQYALPFLLQLSMFASPVLYPSSILPERLQWIYALNPLAGIIEGFRASLFGLEFDWMTLSISATIALGLFIFSAYAFRRLEKTVADII